MRHLSRTVVGLLAGLVGLAGFSPAQVPARKLEGRLPGVLARTPADELLGITIVMSRQVPREELRSLGPGMSKAERRAYVKARLEEVAYAAQSDLLGMLELRLASGEASDVRPLWIHNVIGMRATPALVAEIARRADVAYVHHDPPRGEEVLTSSATALPVSPPGPGAPTCGLELIHAPDVWSQYGITGAGVVVGVIDTGLCAKHKDINDQRWINPCEIKNNGLDDDGNGFVDDIRGWNFQGHNNDTDDGHGHGSHTAGTVGGDGTGGTQCGVAPDARVMALKFWGSSGTEQTVWASMQYGLDNGADVLTASLGWPDSLDPDKPTWRAICENTISAGVVVIYSAGNDGCKDSPNDVRTPANVPDVIAVGAVDCFDVKSDFSSCGPVTWRDVPPYFDHPYPPGLVKPDFAAEGMATISHMKCKGYAAFSGTSMAAPHVAGTAALLLQADPTLDHFGVRALLQATAVDLGTPGKDNETGFGRIDALAAVQAALASGNFCAPKPNSCGGFPLLEGRGHPSATGTDGYVLTASGMAGQQVGFLVYGDRGAARVPLLGGFLCVASRHSAVPLVDTTGTPGFCDGVLVIDMNSFRAGLLGGSPQGFLSIPGTTVNCQMWGRDEQNTFGALLTAGWSYTICP